MACEAVAREAGRRSLTLRRRGPMWQIDWLIDVGDRERTRYHESSGRLAQSYGWP